MQRVGLGCWGTVSVGFICTGVDKDVYTLSFAYHYRAQGGSWVWCVMCVCLCVQQWHNDEGLAGHLQNASSDWCHTRHSFHRSGSVVSSLPAFMDPQDLKPPPNILKAKTIADMAQVSSKLKTNKPRKRFARSQLLFFFCLSCHRGQI